MSLETLESRIAPAGVVNILVTGSDITLVGDGAANLFSASATPGFDALRIAGTAGTTLKLGDLTAAVFDVPVLGIANLVIDLGAGDDELTLTNIALSGNVEVAGGPGSNKTTLNGIMEEEGIFYYLGGDDADSISANLSRFAGGSIVLDLKGGGNEVAIESLEFAAPGGLTVLAGSGDDSVEITGKNGRFGSLTANLGNGENACAVELENVLISSYVKLDGGAGKDRFEISGTQSLVIGKSFKAQLGDGEGELEIVGRKDLVIRGKVIANFGVEAPGQTLPSAAKIGGDHIVLGPVVFSWAANSGTPVGRVAVIAGFDEATGVTGDEPAGSLRMGSMNMQFVHDVTINADAIAVKGSVLITTPLNDVSGAVNETSVTGSFIDIGGDFSQVGGRGSEEIQLVGESVAIGGALALNLGAGDATVNIGATGSSLSAGSVLMTSATMPMDQFALNFFGRLETPGRLLLRDGAGNAQVMFTDADLDLGDGGRINLGVGADMLDMSGSTFRSPGLFSLTLGPATASDIDTASLSYNQTDWDFFQVRGGAGGDRFRIDAASGRIAALKIDLGLGANLAGVIAPGGLRIGRLDFVSTSATEALAERLTLDGINAVQVNARFGAADSALAVTNSRIGTLSADLGAGADTATIDDSILGVVTLNAGAGNDQIEVENDEAHLAASTFLRTVTLNLGTGDDDVLIADTSTATKAGFRGAVFVNGSDGTDTFTAHPTNATFASAPQLTSVP